MEKLLIERVNAAWYAVVDFASTRHEAEFHKRETYRLEGIRLGLEKFLHDSGIKYTVEWKTHEVSKLQYAVYTSTESECVTMPISTLDRHFNMGKYHMMFEKFNLMQSYSGPHNGINQYVYNTAEFAKANSEFFALFSERMNHVRKVCAEYGLAFCFTTFPKIHFFRPDPKMGESAPRGNEVIFDK